eukprot:Filipodium_phascolosomae@DN6165_c0_g1_i1.p1
MGWKKFHTSSNSSPKIGRPGLGASHTALGFLTDSTNGQKLLQQLKALSKTIDNLKLLRIPKSPEAVYSDEELQANEHISWESVWEDLKKIAVESQSKFESNGLPAFIVLGPGKLAVQNNIRCSIMKRIEIYEEFMRKSPTTKR